MATVSITAPDSAVPAIVAAIKRRYPDLTGTDAVIVRAGVARMVREVLRSSEQDRVEREVQAQLDAHRTSAMVPVDAVLAQIV